MSDINKNQYSKISEDIDFLSSSLKKKSIPTKYLYDDIGSKLFEEICGTDEYYLTRTEKKILDKYSSEILNIANIKEFFELGSGSSKKTKVLILAALKKLGRLKYISFDISNKALNMSFSELKNISDDLDIDLIQGDFFNDLHNINKSNNNRMYLFLGSTIGNFNNNLAVKFLSNISKVMKNNDRLLIGIDMIKDREVIKLAYNDKEGITEKFNKNILNVINKKYNLNFNKDNFVHDAIFNEDQHQIEMYLKSKTNQLILLPNNEQIYLNEGDKILTEISRKFSDSTIKDLFEKSYLKIVETFSDEDNYFSMYLLETKYTDNLL